MNPIADKLAEALSTCEKQLSYLVLRGHAWTADIAAADHARNALSEYRAAKLAPDSGSRHMGWRVTPTPNPARVSLWDGDRYVAEMLSDDGEAVLRALKALPTVCREADTSC